MECLLYAARRRSTILHPLASTSRAVTWSRSTSSGAGDQRVPTLSPVESEQRQPFPPPSSSTYGYAQRRLASGLAVKPPRRSGRTTERKRRYDAVEELNEGLLHRRQQWVSRFSGSDVDSLSQWWSRQDSRQDSFHRQHVAGQSAPPPNVLCENAFGLARVPIGLAGPMLLRGQHVNGYVVVPYATTEGALVASASRGGLALNRSGGVRCSLRSEGTRHSPALALHSVEDAQHVAEWIESQHRDVTRRLSEESAVQITSLSSRVLGRTLYLTMKIDSDNAIEDSESLAMATSEAVLSLVTRIRRELPHVTITDFYQHGCLGGDKRVAFTNVFEPQGYSVDVEAFLPESVLMDVLKISSLDLLETFDVMQEGHTHIGGSYMNVNTINAATAVFLATGQDVSRGVDAALTKFKISRADSDEIGKFQFEQQECGDYMREYSGPGVDFRHQGSVHEDGVHVSLRVPSLRLREGDGSWCLPEQRECLSLLHCDGQDSRPRLAEIIAASMLSLEISTTAAVGSGSFASAHDKLGRNRPDLGLRRKDVGDSLFEEVVSELGVLVDWRPSTVDARTSILTDMTKTQLNKIVGHSAMELTYRKEDGAVETVAMVMKSKSTDRETCNVLNRLAQGCGLELASQYESFKMELGFRNCHVRELEMLRHTDPRFTSIAPRTYFIKQNTQKEVLMYFMEHLKDMVHFATADDPKDWTFEDLKLVLGDIAGFHSLYYGKEEELKAKEWMDIRHSSDMMEKEQLWLALAQNNRLEHPEIWTAEAYEMTLRIIPVIGEIWKEFEEAERTLVHNDFNPRNLCIRPDGVDPTGAVSKRRLCCYDWELATLHVPQRDIAELLTFILPLNSDISTWHMLMEHHRRSLQTAVHKDIDAAEYQHLFDLVMCDLFVNRIALYGMVHTFKDYKFCPRLVSGCLVYIQRRSKENARLASLLKM